MHVKHSLSLAFVLFFRKHVFISFALCLMRNCHSYSKWSVGQGNRKCSVSVLWFVSWQVFMVWQKYCSPSSPIEIKLISPSSALLPCKDRQERLWQDSMLVAVVQTALAVFPLGLRFVFSPLLNLKENHAFGGH